ncbi:MAG: prepilin-type N-terminal cleavage/methylation domain-containing protein [Pseudomonadota bacterium]
MPILATGNKTPSSDAGFSLTELLAVLAILSLMVGAVVLNLPAPRSDADRQSELMAAQMTQFLEQGSLRGEMRALGLDETGFTLFRHDGLKWVVADERDWPEDSRIVLEENGDRIDLPERRLPRFLFESYGAVPEMTLILQAPDGEYSLTPDAQGRMIRTVAR